MEQLPKISEAEQQVMRVVWDSNPITAKEIISTLVKKTDWKPETIKTLINRLLKKGAIDYKTSGREYQYYPLIEEDDFTRIESQSFLKRVFGGALKPMLATMVENEDLSQEDIDELKRLLDSKQEK